MTTIRNIKTLKDFGIFHDLIPTDLEDFKKFNLIYGWNRCGKTTISRVFASCERKSIYHKDKFKQYPINGEFELILNNGRIIKSKEIEKSGLSIKVFNKDFIDENVSFEPTKFSNGIVYLSEGDIESNKELEQLKKDNQILLDRHLTDLKNVESKEKIKTNFLQGVGREVSNILFDKTYNRTKVETRINEIGLENFNSKILTEIDKAKNEEITKRKVGIVISNYKNIEIKLLIYGDLNSIYEHIKGLLKKEVISETIDRLKNDEDLNNWVKKGFEIHKSKDEYSKCLFCENPIPIKLFDTLSKHFSKDYTDLQNDIEFFINNTKQLKFTQVDIENQGLYPELQSEYKNIAEQLNLAIKKVSNWLFIHAEGLLEEKSRNPFDKDLFEILEKPENYEKQINDCIVELNKIFNQHNKMVNGHTDQVIKSKEKLELHTIASALIQDDYKKINNELLEAEKVEQESKEKLTRNQGKIEKLERETSQISGALNKINSHLKSFFGKTEITLDLDDSKKGYLIYREGSLASNLSEGEKTAIAFSYFIVKVEERDFKINESIIFIDDPISSLDSNFIYHSFSLIKEQFKDVGQLFISTHNFHFFNLIKEWFIQKNEKIKEANLELKQKNLDIKPIPCEFYMIESFIEDKKRKSTIKLLDRTLMRFKSEYHFLFNRINEFLKKSPEYADLYSIGNISRRYFEIYADFKIPDNSNPRQKMEKLVKVASGNGAEITTVDLGKVYKLINEYSHNYDPMSTIEHTDKSESVEAIKTLLNIVKFSDKSHYETLEKSCLAK